MSLVRLSFELGMAVSDYNCGITNDHSAIIRATFMYLDKVRVTSLDEDELVECYAIIGQMWAAVIERSEDIVSSEPESKVESKAPVAKAPEPKAEPKAPEAKVEPKAPVAKVEPKVEPKAVAKAPEAKVEPKAPEAKVEPKAPVAKVEPKAAVAKAPEPKAPVAKAPVTHSI